MERDAATIHSTFFNQQQLYQGRGRRLRQCFMAWEPSLSLLAKRGVTIEEGEMCL